MQTQDEFIRKYLINMISPFQITITKSTLKISLLLVYIWEPRLYTLMSKTI